MIETVEIRHLNAYGYRWHIFLADGRLIWSGYSKQAARAYCKRHALHSRDRKQEKTP